MGVARLLGRLRGRLSGGRVPGSLFSRAAPAWLTWLLVAGLTAVYAGERILAGVVPARVALSGGGALIVFGAVAWRFLSWKRASAEARPTEKLFLMAYAGCALSLVGFFLAGDGADWLGIDFTEPVSESRFQTAATVLACIVLAASLLPALAAQWAVGLGHRSDGPAGVVDRLRISELAATGLTVGLAGPMLLLAGYVASERDKMLDLGYFRTASPGTAAVQIVESMGGSLRVLLFFPPSNEVKDQVVAYFRTLEGASDNVEIEEHDRLAAPAVAEEHRVTEDGTIVLAAGDRSERIILPTRISEARRQLRTLDESVQKSLMRVAREERTIYLTVGHGELNDPSSTGPLEAAPFRRVDALRGLFELLNYRIQDLGVQNGLGNEVPTDAAMVLVFGPQRPFLEPELQALDRYLARGGSLLLALEPDSDFQLGPLTQRLGVQYRSVPLADDREHLRQRGNTSDRRLIVTDRFSSHAAVATLGRAWMGAGILLMGAGSLEPTPDSRATFVIRSLESTFEDEDLDFEFDDGEERKMHALAAVVETEGAAPADTTGGAPGMRAFVLADADLFSDAVVSSLGLNAALAADAIRWLGHEEEMAGETTSEEDVPIVHTRTEDVAWFYSTILGVPTLVLTLGLLGVRKRRRSGGKAKVGTAT